MSKNTVCPYLWNHQFFSIRNTGAPCCRSYKQDDPRWNDIKLEDGINSYLHKEAREQMRQGQWPDICGVCRRLEEDGSKSGRQIALEQYPDIDYSSEPDKIVFADLKFNNTCNLKCRMCDDAASSSIYDEFKDIPAEEHPKFFRLNIPIADYQDEFKLEYIKDLIKNGLELFKITGGEPFAQIYFIRLIDWCIEHGYNKDLEIHITTNGTKFNKSLLEKLRSFKRIYTIISMDGVGPVYEYIRYPSTWDKFTYSLYKFKDYTEKYPDVFEKPIISAVLQAYNLFNIADIYNFCEDIGFACNIDPGLKPSYSEFNTEHLPLWLKQKAIDEFITKAYTSFHKHSKAQTVLTRLKKNLEKPQYYQTLKQTTLNLDKHRDQCYTDSLHSSMVEFLNKY